MKFILPKKLNLAQLPTPIQKLPRLSTFLGGPDISIKRDDLTGVAVSGNKVRKLEFTVAEALQKKCTVLITCGGLQSNHCRATAAVAARLGLKCHLVLRGEAPDIASANLLLDLLFGAQITYLPGADSDKLYVHMLKLADQYAQQGERAQLIPIGASNALGSLGYVAAVHEMVTQFQELQSTPDRIVVAVGSGGTLAGLVIGKYLFGLSSQIIGINVCDDADTFRQEVTHIVQEFREQYDVNIEIEPTDYDIIDGYVGDGYALSRPEERRFISNVAQTEGIILDTTYTGKALYGLSQEIQKGTFQNEEKILFIHTGGIYGLFAQPDLFQDLLKA